MDNLTKEQILEWCRKYDTEEDQYNTGLETELGNKLRTERELDKQDLIKIVEWKFQGRLLGRRKIAINRISKMDSDAIKNIIRQALDEQDENLRIRNLMGRYGGINGVGLSLASVILTFYNPKNYGVYDIHVWRELFGKEPKDLFNNFNNLTKFLFKLREIANQHQLDVRIVEKALFKKNYDENEKKM